MYKHKLIVILSISLFIMCSLIACQQNKSGSSNNINNEPIKKQSANSQQKPKGDPPPAPKPAPKKATENKKPIKKKTSENEVVASFSTKIIDYDEDRIHNIRLAAQKINSCVLRPGEIFSFNKIVGKREYGKGYRKAGVLVKGKHSEDVGGGICQLSSTIYNAALKLDLKIIERHNHSGDIHYIPQGQDAAVSYGYEDLQFKNTKSYSIKFRVSVENGKTSVLILKA
jgi:vancomycin resistance protein YoaR